MKFYVHLFNTERADIFKVAIKKKYNVYVNSGCSKMFQLLNKTILFSRIDVSTAE